MAGTMGAEVKNGELIVVAPLAEVNILRAVEVLVDGVIPEVLADGNGMNRRKLVAHQSAVDARRVRIGDDGKHGLRQRAEALLRNLVPRERLSGRRDRRSESDCPTSPQSSRNRRLSLPAVGTVPMVFYAWFCRNQSALTWKKVRFFPLYTWGIHTGPPTVNP